MNLLIPISHILHHCSIDLGTRSIPNMKFGTLYPSLLLYIHFLPPISALGLCLATPLPACAFHVLHPIAPLASAPHYPTSTPPTSLAFESLHAICRFVLLIGLISLHNLFVFIFVRHVEVVASGFVLVVKIACVCDMILLLGLGFQCH